MKINHKILSLPPYISTSWKNILSLHLEIREIDHILVIGLVNGSTIEIPNLDKAILQAIFSAHEKYLEQENSQKSPSLGTPSIGSAAAIIGMPLNLGVEGLDLVGSMMQHNQEAANSPNLPPEVLERIAALAKAIGLENNEMLPKAEPHCNCMHCQILRTMHGNEPISLQEEEEVTEQDLKFRDWEVNQIAEKLYKVTNPLNAEEHYNVFLGSPIGCTCGEKNCEHIRTVLNS